MKPTILKAHLMLHMMAFLAATSTKPITQKRLAKYAVLAAKALAAKPSGKRIMGTLISHNL